MSASVRYNYGIMLSAIIENSGIAYSGVSFILAVGQFIFGAVQPVFGIMGAKKGNISVLVSGVILMLAGMILLPFCNSAFSLMICLGFLLPAGTGALGYGIIMGAITPKLPENTVSTVSGIVIASGGLGNILMSPVLAALILTGGLLHSMFLLTIPTALMLPVSIWMGWNKKKTVNAMERDTANAPEAEKTEFDVGAVFRDALKSRTYIFLMAGFFTCGFHMAIVMNHLPTEIVTHGFTSEQASYAFSIYGFATVLGSFLSGSLCNKLKMKDVLGMLYGLRPVAVILFMLLPKTMFSVCLFTALLGFSGPSTVPPVAGIVRRSFGVRSMATLFGFVFLVHQIGAFFSAWFAGICFEQTGGYVVIWLVDIVLCVLASGISFLIRNESNKMAGA
jgi:MFS family permease